ncbi:hypothetical protein [Parendozoicomonas haliclonae]|uniref:Sel1 repeat protein n=1 Tax=Parendozoicomonas haliclonae TaxID=1960125 RepID=A0A1X7AKQ5_9GAMM|nr:hypothetical protein [Parendozoicomonas haliclonae]SMA48267.1 hypothetical protein EHSB41UT_02673 [Parendozoicomonas haliclonae]
MYTITPATYYQTVPAAPDGTNNNTSEASETKSEIFQGYPLEESGSFGERVITHVNTDEPEAIASVVTVCTESSELSDQSDLEELPPADLPRPDDQVNREEFLMEFRARLELPKIIKKSHKSSSKLWLKGCWFLLKKSYWEAKTIFEEACSVNNVKAQTNLAAMLVYERKDRERAKSLLNIAACGGILPAIYHLGMMELQDGKKLHAAQWLAQAAAREHEGALNWIMDSMQTTQAKFYPFFLYLAASNHMGDSRSDLGVLGAASLNACLLQYHLLNLNSGESDSDAGSESESFTVLPGFQGISADHKQSLKTLAITLDELMTGYSHFQSNKKFQTLMKDMADAGVPEACIFHSLHLQHLGNKDESDNYSQLATDLFDEEVERDKEIHRQVAVQMSVWNGRLRSRPHPHASDDKRQNKLLISALRKAGVRKATLKTRRKVHFDRKGPRKALYLRGSEYTPAQLYNVPGKHAY